MDRNEFLLSFLIAEASRYRPPTKAQISALLGIASGFLDFVRTFRKLDMFLA
jgi:hypothetical protein